jgi:death-on-curing protein
LRYIDYKGVIEIHKEIVTSMGGKFAVINEGNLHYCLDSVLEISKQVALLSSCIEKAAHYIWCITLAHAFLDANKRTAYQVAYVFLLANGFKLYGVDKDEAVSIITNISIAKTTIESVREWISKHIKPVSR